MNWKIIIVVIAVLLIVVGCEQFAQNMVDPNSSLNQTVDAVSLAAPVVGAGATATGTPWGAAVGLIATIIATAVGVYNNYRKKIVIGEKDATLQNTETATRAIIEAVENLSGVELEDGKTIGDEIKAVVKERLQDKDFYRIGKAIIDGLK